MFSLMNNVYSNFKLYIYFSNFYIYLSTMVMFIMIDMLCIDDEPLWEPLEWSLMQSWLVFIFLFSWVIETFMSAKYGSYTGSDKSVYYGLFSSYWYIELWFMVNLFATCVFVIVPFFFEVTYEISYVMTWWEWYNSMFLLKFFLMFFMINSILMYVRKKNIYKNWKNVFFLFLMMNLLLSYVLFYQFIMVFFCYFTDTLDYNKNGWLDYLFMTKGPSKWGWGFESSDHFSYHKTTTSFWFKNDPMYASAFFFLNIFIFFSLFKLFLQNLFFLSSMYSMKNISYLKFSYMSSSIITYYYFMTLFIIFMVTSMFYFSMKFPVDLTYFPNSFTDFEFFSLVINNFLEFILVFLDTMTFLNLIIEKILNLFY